MTCNDVQRILPEMMDGARDAEFLTHVEKCPACSELVSDLELISSEARQLADSAEPSPRVWLAIAAELRSEGLIREPEPQFTRPLPMRRRWNAWWMVPVAAALVIVGSYVVKPKPVREVAQQQQAVVVTPQQQPQEPPAVVHAPRNTPNPPSENETASAEDQQFLQEVSTRAPGMKNTYENELRAVNSYLSDAKAYVKQHPEDEEARQHLMDAYEQKAMLYQMALDHIQ
jgi:hypothetical protein